MQEINVGLIGFGTVGSGLAQVIYEQAGRIEKRVGASIRLKTVADIMVDTLPDHISQNGKVALTKDANEIFDDPEINVVVELIGGIEPAKSFMLHAIEKGKHVVTANKALLSQHGREIFEAAARNKVEVGFEASVGGGIPVIKSLKEGLVANRIQSIMGIMNGTANYILTQMTDHATPFAEVLKDAQEKGYGSHRSSPLILNLPGSSATASSYWPSVATTATMWRPECIPPWCQKSTCWPISTALTMPSISKVTWWAMWCSMGWAPA
jgi:homoserine dehydrogenase